MLAFASERKSPAWSKFRQGKNHIKFALLWTLFSFLISSLSFLGHLKAFCFAPRLFFSLREVFVSFSFWHHLSLSFSLYFNTSISTKNFPTSLSFPIPGTKGQFPVDTVLLLCLETPKMLLPLPGPVRPVLLQGQPALEQCLSKDQRAQTSVPKCCLELRLCCTVCADTLGGPAGWRDTAAFPSHSRKGGLPRPSAYLSMSPAGT